MIMKNQNEENILLTSSSVLKHRFLIAVYRWCLDFCFYQNPKTKNKKTKNEKKKMKKMEKWKNEKNEKMKK